MHESAYHHGDLRNALLERALAMIADSGLATFSLRAAAAAVGVTAAAAYRHFASKDALLAELAADGFAVLSAQMRAATLSARKRATRRARARSTAPGGAQSPPRMPIARTSAAAVHDSGPDDSSAIAAFEATGACYLRFACEQPTRFRLMFGTRSDTYREMALALLRERGVESSYDILHEAIAGIAEVGRLRPKRVEDAVNVAWSAVHGMALLMLDGYLDMPSDTRDARFDALVAGVRDGIVLPAGAKR